MPTSKVHLDLGRQITRITSRTFTKLLGACTGKGCSKDQTYAHSTALSSHKCSVANLLRLCATEAPEWYNPTSQLYRIRPGSHKRSEGKQS